MYQLVTTKLSIVLPFDGIPIIESITTNIHVVIHIPHTTNLIDTVRQTKTTKNGIQPRLSCNCTPSCGIQSNRINSYLGNKIAMKMNKNSISIIAGINLSIPKLTTLTILDRINHVSLNSSHWIPQKRFDNQHQSL